MEKLNPAEVYSGLDKNEVYNNNGGISYASNCWQKLDRYLIIGAESGTFYVNPRKHMANNIDNLSQCVKENGKRVVDRTVEVSDLALAPKNDQAIFVMAFCIANGDEETKVYARSKINKVVRTASHLTMFVNYVTKLRGWGRGLRKAISSWYTTLGKHNPENVTDKEDDQRNLSSLVYQMMKYNNRNGYTQRDILRLSHVKPTNPYQATLFSWITKPDTLPVLPSEENAEALLTANEELYKYAVAKQLNNYDTDAIVQFIKKYNLPHEVIPTTLRDDKNIWQALIDAGMPLNALIRNLGKLAHVGLTEPLSANAKKICETFRNEEYVKKSRIHPINVLNQMKGYEKERSMSGLRWKINNDIVEALDDMFYLSFKNVEPTNKNTLIALDVSSSMSWGAIAGINLTSAEVAAAMAMVTLRTEPNCMICAFSDTFIDIPINRKMSLPEILDITASYNFGNTDCSLPMIEAKRRRLDIDTFCVYTDSETGYHQCSPAKALRQYRNKSGKANAKLVVVACEANDFTIADPNDNNMLDIAGFSSAVPQVISYFSANNL